MQRSPALESESFDHVLSSMCTEPHPAARTAAERFLASNPGDPATYEEVSRLETKAIDLLAEIVDHPAPDAADGYITSGGTEANIQAVRAARNLSEADEPNVVVPESAHFSFTKAAELLDVELRTVPLDGKLRADLEAVSAAVDEETALVVGVAGTTEYGRVDPIPELCAIAHEADARMHVDAAWGGFVLPFTDRDWTFSDAPIDTLTIDPHKFGRAVVPSGGLLTRDGRTLDALAVETPYLETYSQATLTGTRSGAGVASAVAAIEELWPTGYREAAKRSQQNADWLASALADRGYEVVDPTLPLVAASIPKPIFEELRAVGWKVARTARGEVRIVCMPHVTRERLEAFLRDLDRLD